MGRVLHLDDDQAIAALIAHWAESLGHSVSSFSDAEKALATFEARPQGFDLVLTDMSMPGMNGLEFAQRILAIDPEAVVVIATGCPDPNWADHARASGVLEVIGKPTTFEEMAEAARRFLEP